MNRRNLFLTSAAATLVAASPAQARGSLRLATTEGEPGHEEYRAICERGDRNKIRVYLNGTNVTESCRAASEPEGYVWVAKRDHEGWLYTVNGEFAEEQLFGDVRIEL